MVRGMLLVIGLGITSIIVGCTDKLEDGYDPRRPGVSAAERARLLCFALYAGGNRSSSEGSWNP